LPLLPQPEEAKALRRLKDHDGLAPSDVFLLTMLQVPLVNARVSALLYASEFDARTAEVRHGIGLWRSATLQIRNSRRFQRLMELVLGVGNAMNAGHMILGSAMGCSVDSCSLLKEVRSVDKSATLLQYVAAIVLREAPDIMNVVSLIEPIQLAQRVPIDSISAEVGVLLTGWDELERTIRGVNQSMESADSFVGAMTAFASSSSDTLSRLQEDLDAMRRGLSDTVVFLGEDAKADAKAPETFAHIATFLTDFELACTQVRPLMRDSASGQLLTVTAEGSPSKAHRSHKKDKKSDKKSEKKSEKKEAKHASAETESVEA